MEIAKLKVDGVYAGVVMRSPVTAGLVGGTICVEYAPGIWDGLTKTVVFKGVATKDVVTDETLIEIPHETVAAPNKRLQVGFYGVDGSGVLIVPTLWADLGLILPGADPSGDTSVDPSLPVWAQLAEDLKRLEESGGADPETIGKLVEDYLEENPPSGGAVDLTGYATKEWVTKGYQPKGNYLTQHQDISGKLDASKLPEAINTALAQAKASGEFDGKDGKPPVKGTDYWTADDKSAMVSDVLAALPTWNGGSY